MTCPLTVLMVNTFHHHRGGDSSYTFALTAALQARGHTVHPFAMAHPRNLPGGLETDFAAPIDYGALAARSKLRAGLVALTRGIWNLDAAAKLDRLLDRIRPDVAHLQHVHHHLTPSVLTVLNRRRIPVVWTLHDYELLCPTGHFFREGAVCEACRVTRFDQAIRHRCERNSAAASAIVALEKGLHRLLGVLERVDRFLTPSDFLRRKLIEYGVDPARVTHLPNFLDVTGPPTPLPADGFILFAGRLTPEKGVRVLIDAARDGLPAPLHIAGDGPERTGLEAAAAPLIAAGKVQFLGAVPHAEMPDLLRRAGAVVVPSIWYENFPFAVLEGFAAGRPVVASRIGGIPEQIEDGVSGMLAIPGSSHSFRQHLAALWADPARARAIGEAGYRRLVAEFGSSRHLTRLEIIYGEVITRISRGSG